MESYACIGAHSCVCVVSKVASYDIAYFTTSLHDLTVGSKPPGWHPTYYFRGEGSPFPLSPFGDHALGGSKM